MAEFKIDTAAAANSANQLRSLSRELNELYGRAEGIRAAVNYRTLSIRNLMAKLSNADARVLEQAADLDTLAEALDAVIGYYVRTERAILSGTEAGEPAYESRESTQGIGDWFREQWENACDTLMSWGIIRAEEQHRTEGQTVTAEQQWEMDLYMQQQIDDVLNEFRFSRLSWWFADMTERQAILNEYLQRVAAILGLSVGAIDFFHSEPQNGYVTWGQYDPDTNTVQINDWALSDECLTSYSILETLVHEMRHAYQQAAVDNPDQFVVTEETLREWQENMDDYNSTADFMNEQGMTQQEAHQAYENQPIERDARAFAGQ